MDIEQYIEQLVEESGVQMSGPQFRARSVIQKLAYLYPDDAHGDLWLAILSLALLDVCTYRPQSRNSFFAVDAFKYLSQPVIPCCDVAGVDTDYVKSVVSQTLAIDLR